jgi:catechol 2,3-dioxygenase-like lactoylglutathione lyase family enzyme
MITGISHVTLSVAELARSLAFYHETMELRLVARWPKGAYLASGGLWLALFQDNATRVGPLPEYTHIAFAIGETDFAPLAARIKASGATIFQQNSSEGLSLYFLDPDGHKLEIHVGDLESRLRAAREQPWPGLEIFAPA